MLRLKRVKTCGFVPVFPANNLNRIEQELRRLGKLCNVCTTRQYNSDFLKGYLQGLDHAGVSVGLIRSTSCTSDGLPAITGFMLEGGKYRL